MLSMALTDNKGQGLDPVKLIEIAADKILASGEGLTFSQFECAIERAMKSAKDIFIQMPRSAQPDFMNGGKDIEQTLEE